MKKRFFYLLAALPLVAACDPAALTRSAAPGTEIRFSANTSYDNMPGTKTVYSGQTYDVALSGTTAKYERIDWVGGDKIRICRKHTISFCKVITLGGKMQEKLA